MYNKGYGAFIAAHSAKGRHLTWSLLEGAVLGLYNALYLQGKYRTSEFWVWDGTAGLVGVGKMATAVADGGRRNSSTLRWTGLIELGAGNSSGSGNAAGNREVRETSME